MEYKYISEKKYWKVPEGFYNREDAIKEKNRIEEKTKTEEKKFRYYIEKVYVFGSAVELFVPGYKYYLWINKI